PASTTTTPARISEAVTSMAVSLSPSARTRPDWLRLSILLFTSPTGTPSHPVMLSEAKHLWLFLIRIIRKRSEILRFAQNDNIGLPRALRRADSHAFAFEA